MLLTMVVWDMKEKTVGVKVVDVGLEPGGEHIFVSSLIAQTFFWVDYCPKAICIVTFILHPTHQKAALSMCLVVHV